MKPFTHGAIAIFTLVAAAHLLRVIFGWEVIIGGWAVPMWISIVATLITGGFAVMLWHESRPSR